jgi:hypothetical protein
LKTDPGENVKVNVRAMIGLGKNEILWKWPLFAQPLFIWTSRKIRLDDPVGINSSSFMRTFIAGLPDLSWSKHTNWGKYTN